MKPYSHGHVSFYVCNIVSISEERRPMKYSICRNELAETNGSRIVFRHRV